MASKTMKAVKVLGINHAEVQDVPLPELQAHEILVKVHCVALNPLDWKISLPMTPIAGATLGSDFSGTVAALGPSIKKPWHVGDRVCGWVVGNNVARKDNGGFAEFCAVDAELCLRVPAGMSDEEAASPAAGIATAGMGVFMKQGIALPGAEDGGKGAEGETMLVYGATSATGTIAIQMAKLAGLNVIATCSAPNIPAVKALGASEAFDYKDPACAQHIREYTHDSLGKIFDTISEGSSVGICSAAMGARGGTVITTLPWPAERPRADAVAADMLFTLGVFGVPTGYGEQVVPANLDDYAYAKRLYAVAEKWLADGKLKVHPPRLCKEGLEGVFDAIERAKRGEGSGVKLVVKL